MKVLIISVAVLAIVAGIGFSVVAFRWGKALTTLTDLKSISATIEKFAVDLHSHQIEIEEKKNE